MAASTTRDDTQSAAGGAAPADRDVNLLVLCLLALVLGLGTGLGAVGFRALIALVHNLAYTGKLSFSYDANLIEDGSRFGVFLFLSPVIGGLVVVFLVKTFAPEAKGHGVPEVMDSIFYKRGDIRGLVAVVKSLASAISIGTGAAVGREGPIIQIGSAIGSTFGRLVRLTTWQKVTLLAAGAGAGIAATFNTPLGGVLFALEILLPEVSNRTFLPVVIATGAATYVGRILLGPAPAFLMPAVNLPSPDAVNLIEVLALVLLGAIAGVASWLFIRVLVFMEDAFPALPGNAYTQNLVGMSIVGTMMVGFTGLFGHPYVDGVGYGIIQTVLDGRMHVGWLLLLLFFAKLLATTVSLGAGASGGIFSPSLYLGATLGGSIGVLVTTMLPGAGLSVPAAAIVGMAAIVGAGTGGVMTAIVMIFEMTRDYAVIVPVILAVAVASGVRRTLIAETIYTVKLRHRGHRIPKDRHLNLYLVQQARDIMERDFIKAELGTPLLRALDASGTQVLPPIVVTHGDNIAGLVPPRSGLWATAMREPSATVDAYVEKDYVFVRDTDLLGTVFEKLNRRRKSAVIVFRDAPEAGIGDIVGIITKRAIADAVIDGFDG